MSEHRISCTKLEAHFEWNKKNNQNGVKYIKYLASDNH